MRKVSLKRKRNGNSDNGDDSITKPDENNQNGGGDEDVDPLDGTEKVTSTTTKKKGGKNVKKGAKKAKTAAKSNNDDDEAGQNGDGGEDDTAEEEEEYEVEDIIDHKTVRGKLQYLIRWKGYDADNDSWEPESTVNCPDIVARYNEKNLKPEKKGKPKKVAKEADQDENEEPINEEEQEDDIESEKAPLNKKTIGRGRPKQRKSTGRPKKVDNDRDKNSDDDNEENDEVEYEVEKIIDVHFKRNGDREFLIRWKGFKSDADTWEPEDNVNCPDLIDKFMKKVNDAKSKQSKDLRTDRNHTKRFTLSTNDAGRRISKRHNNKQRVSYFDNE